MHKEKTHKRRHRIRLKSRRRLASVLLAVGLLGLAIGLGFTVARHFYGVGGMGRLGVLYVGCSLLVLGIRLVVNKQDADKKKKYRERAASTSSAAPRKA